MKNGKAYIVFALDVASLDEAKRYVNILNGKVGMFKIGLELFMQTGPDIIRQIRELTNAGIFLDLKFHDISETVKRTMEIVAALRVNLVTVHCSSSQKMLEMAVQGAAKNDSHNLGVLGVTVLTDHDASVIQASGFKDAYVDDISALVMKRAKMAYYAGCRGVVCSGNEAALIKSAFGKDFLAVTPGIRPSWSIEKLKSSTQNENFIINDDQKRITTPAMAVRSGADLIVIGRPIKRAKDPAYAADMIAQEIDLFLNEGNVETI